MNFNRYPFVSGIAYRTFAIVLLTSLLVSPGLLPVSQATASMNVTDTKSLQKVMLIQGSPSIERANLDATHTEERINSISDTALPPLNSTGWWDQVQEDIHLSEYYITWQEHTYLSDLEAAYQAPNRTQDLRIYFTPQSIHLIPRRFDGDTPPWEWNLTLNGYGYSASVLPVADASQNVHKQRIEYQRDVLTEWYLNDEGGLQQGFTLYEPPIQGRGSNEEVELELSLSGNLIPWLTPDNLAVELSSPGGPTVLRYAVGSVIDASGRALPTQIELNAQTLRISFDASNASYPIQVTSTITGLSPSSDWTAESDQLLAHFGDSLSTAGDVNGDGYSDVIIGAYAYDTGQTDEGGVFVYYGSNSGLSASPNWSAEGDQAYAKFGSAVGIAGDVNGDGYSDVVIGASGYDHGQTDEGAAFVYYGSAEGLRANPTWMVESNQAGANFGSSAGTAGDVNGDGYSDVVVGAPLFDNDQDNEGYVFVYYGSANGLSVNPSWTGEGDHSGAWFGFSVGTAGDVNGDGYSDVVVGAYTYANGQDAEGAAFVYHGSVSGLNSTANWTVESDKDYAYYGWSVGTAGDVNGDGFSDVIIGAPYYTNDQDYEGRAYVYHGSSGGLSITPAWEAEGDQFGAQFGSSVGAAGDVNGDGYADVIVGAPDYDNGQEDEGGAYVYFGGAGGIGTNAQWTAEGDQVGANFGSKVATAGDVNGDGFSDVIIGASDFDNGQEDEGGAFVYHGGVGGLSATAHWTNDGNQDGAYFGWSLGTAGDVNGDGYSDVIIAARRYDNGQTDEGRVYVYHGGANGLSLNPAWIVESNLEGAWFGSSVGTAGDVNGDGYSDVVIGAEYFSNGEDKEGSAFVYLGSSEGLRATPAWKAEGNQVYACFGKSVGTAGDVNGDGYSDVVIGAPYFDGGQQDEGRAYVYLGQSNGLKNTPHWLGESDVDGALFGSSVGTAGDVNGDGYSDVIIGAPGYDSDQDSEGRAYVYLGGPDGLTEIPQWIKESNQSFANFGNSVGTAGDVNGDGFSDVIIGALNYDNGEDYEGRAYVYLGIEIGLSTTPHWTAEGNQAGASFGSAVGTGGDVNGDGYSDVVVGAPGFDAGQDGEGRAYVYLGSSNGLSISPHWMAEGDQVYAHFGSSVGTVGDVNGDGYSEVIIGMPYYDDVWLNVGRANLYYGNGGGGVPLLPRQLQNNGSALIPHLGMSTSGTSFQVSLIGRMPLGRQKVRLQWQVAPLGVSFSDPEVIQGSTPYWIDSGTDGLAITHRIVGLTVDTAYHWRVRLIYPASNALGQRRSRWVHIPWSGWLETDLRTASDQLYLPIVHK